MGHTTTINDAHAMVECWLRQFRLGVFDSRFGDGAVRETNVFDELVS